MKQSKLLVKNMLKNNDESLKNYEVAARTRQDNIWLRTPLVIKVFNKEMAIKS